MTEPPCSDHETVRYRINLAYEGTGFQGWAIQPALRTVQGAVEAALCTLFQHSGPPPRLVVAGRTDAGVHAIAQVAHFDLTRAQQHAVGKASITRRLNGLLGSRSDITVFSVEPAAPGFDARFSALWRRYEYRIADETAARNPLERHRTLWTNRKLNSEAMVEAAQSLLGLHDFATFCKQRDGATTIRTLHDFDWCRDEHGILIASVRADAFCRSMVRALVGGCVAVGDGKIRSQQLSHLRDSRERGAAFATVPARGLTLVEIGYPSDEQLQERAKQTRALRCL